MTQQNSIYKVQNPGTPMGDYTLSNKYLELDNEDSYTMVVLAEQFTPGEQIVGGNLIEIADNTDDLVSGPFKIYSKITLNTKELLTVLMELIGATVECKKKVTGDMHTIIAIDVISNKKLFVMNLSHGYDTKMTVKDFQHEYSTTMWQISQVIH